MAWGPVFLETSFVLAPEWRFWETYFIRASRAISCQTKRSAKMRQQGCRDRQPLIADISDWVLITPGEQLAQLDVFGIGRVSSTFVLYFLASLSLESTGVVEEPESYFPWKIITSTATVRSFGNELASSGRSLQAFLPLAGQQ